jgi:hypothetical protein
MRATLDYYVPWSNMHGGRTDSKRDALVGALSVVGHYGRAVCPFRYSAPNNTPRRKALTHMSVETGPWRTILSV